MDYVKLINCMRCGMCLPHCPTYKETFLETASPRGRVALVRKFQEGELEISEKFLEYLSLCLDCQACASACPCGVNAGELVAEFKCEKKEGRVSLSWKSWFCAVCFPTPTVWRPSIKPMRLYQKSGLQKVVRKLGLLKMFPSSLERMEGLLPELPARPLRQMIEESDPGHRGGAGDGRLLPGLRHEPGLLRSQPCHDPAALFPRLPGDHSRRHRSAAGHPTCWPEIWPG